MPEGEAPRPAGGRLFSRDGKTPPGPRPLRGRFKIKCKQLGLLGSVGLMITRSRQHVRTRRGQLDAVRTERECMRSRAHAHTGPNAWEHIQSGGQKIGKLYNPLVCASTPGGEHETDGSCFRLGRSLESGHRSATQPVRCGGGGRRRCSTPAPSTQVHLAWIDVVEIDEGDTCCQCAQSRRHTHSHQRALPCCSGLLLQASEHFARTTGYAQPHA